MCILLLHYHPSSSLSDSSSTETTRCTCPYVLVVAVNRDEFYDRPTQPLHFWQDQPDIVAGRDMMREELGECGTWMGISRQGRFAVLTNYRCHISEVRRDAVTRGSPSWCRIVRIVVHTQTLFTIFLGRGKGSHRQLVPSFLEC